jgi:hypothetical protein
MKALTLLPAFVAAIIVAASTSAAKAAPTTTPQFASEADRANYYTVQKIEVREITTSDRFNGRIESLLKNQAAHLSNSGASAGAIAGPIIGIITDPTNIEAWITLGDKAWQVVMANKPVSNVTTKRVSVLPQSQQDWTGMDSWQGPAHKTYVVEAKNLYGISVVSHVYTLAFNYGGKINGKGQFLANATIIPSNVQVAWGYTLNSGVDVGETLNMGAKDSPTPGVDLQLSWTVDTFLKHIEARDDFFVRGDGQVVRMNGTN